jgi:transmembrane sensor
MKPELELIEGGDPIRRRAAAWFARLRADDVSGADLRAWQDWIDADPRHRAAYERLERLWTGLGTHAPHPEIARRLDAVAPADRGERTRPRRRWPVAAGLAATLALALLGAWQLLVPAAPTERVYATGVGERRELALEDGTRITLDTDSRLHVAFGPRARTVVLDRGRAFFRVARERRPLTVHTAHGGLRVVGTEFELNRRADALDVALIEGEVVLLPLDDGRDDRPAPLLGLVAGQTARLSRDLGTPQIGTLSKPAAPAWLSGRLVFEDATLAEVVAEFNRYSHERIVIDDASLTELRVTGVFRSDAPLAFVGALCEAYPIVADASTPGRLRLRHDPDRHASHAPGQTGRRAVARH